MKNSILLLALVLIASCGTSSKTAKTKRPPKREVIVAFNVNTGNHSELNFINMDYYRLRILDKLDDFQNVNFILAEPDDTPEITINLNINNFVLWPRNEQVSRRVLTRVVQTGTDAAGKPIYQTVRASVDIFQVERRSNASFLVDMRIKGAPQKTYKQSFFPRYNYKNVYVDNIQGDSRAINPSLYFSRNQGVEPDAMDFLFQLSGEMVDRVSQELRSYYRK
jgi:hypothetical protein